MGRCRIGKAAGDGWAWHSPALAVCERHTHGPRREVIHQLVQAFVPADMPCGRPRPLPPIPCADAQFRPHFAGHKPVVGIQHLCSADVARNGLADHRNPSLPFHLGIRQAGTAPGKRMTAKAKSGVRLRARAETGNASQSRLAFHTSMPGLVNPWERNSPSWFSPGIVDHCRRGRWAGIVRWP